MKSKQLFQMPKAVSILGRSSSITAAFVTAIVPAIEPSDREVREALEVLGMSPETICCAYCGEQHTEWEHLRPLVLDKQATGHISEIANLVPSCGKCNQSKGNKEWRKWMTGGARRSPRARGVPDLEERIERLAAYERWRVPTRLKLDELVESELWKTHWANRDRVFALLRESQAFSVEVAKTVASAIRSQAATSEKP